MPRLHSPQPRLSVIIPTMRQRYLRRCLLGLLKQSDANFEVIIIENGHCSLYTHRVIGDFVAQLNIRYLYDPTPGANRARNLGARLASAPLLAFIDDDCVPDRNWVETLCHDTALIHQHSVVGGKVALNFSETPPGWFTGVFVRSLSAVDLGARHRPLHEWEYIVSANMAMSKQTFQLAGGFDQGIGIKGRSEAQLGNDEIEFIRRFVRGGGKLIYNPNMCVTHLVPAERVSPQRIALRRYGQGLSDIALAVREQQQTGALQLEPVQLAQQVCEQKNGSQWLNNMVSVRDELTGDDLTSYDRYSRMVRLSYLCGLATAIQELVYQEPLEPLAPTMHDQQQAGGAVPWLSYLFELDMGRKDRWLTDWTRTEVRRTLTGARTQAKVGSING